MKTIKILAVAFIGIATMAAAPKKVSNYKVNDQKSELTWLAKKVTGEHTGKIAIAGGNLITEGEEIKSGTFEINMNTMTCTDLNAEYGQKLIGHLKSPDFFDTEKHKTAKLEITKVEKNKDGNTIVGKLTIKGITNEIRFPASIKFDGKTLVAVGKATVDRTKYDIKYGSKNFFENIGDKAIDNDFFIDFKVIATL